MPHIDDDLNYQGRQSMKRSRSENIDVEDKTVQQELGAHRISYGHDPLGYFGWKGTLGGILMFFLVPYIWYLLISSVIQEGHEFIDFDFVCILGISLILFLAGILVVISLVVSRGDRIDTYEGGFKYSSGERRIIWTGIKSVRCAMWQRLNISAGAAHTIARHVNTI